MNSAVKYLKKTISKTESENKIYLFSIIIFVLAISIRFFYWSEYRDTALDDWHIPDQTDMSTYVEQSKQIKSGNWLAATPYHPYHKWQHEIPEVEWNKWYGHGVFHQAPAYSYFLAGLSFVSDDPLDFVKTIQLIIGSFSCVLIFLICHYLVGLSASFFAGVLSAFYAPMFYLEAQVLREAFSIFCMLLILYLVIRYVFLKKERVTNLISIAPVGIILGLFTQLHQMGIVLTLTILFVLIFRNIKLYKQALAHSALLLLGFAIGFAPWAIRNIEVGAPLMSVSSRAPIVFVQSNEANAVEGGAYFDAPTFSMAKILDAAYEDKENIIVGVLKSYHGDIKLFFNNWWLRFKAIWTRYERPDNTSYYFYMEMVPVLKWMPNFSMVFPLGAAAILLIGLAGVKEKSVAVKRNTENVQRNIHFLLIFWVVILITFLSMAHSTGRFRVYLVPFFIIYTGVFIDISINAYRNNNSGKILTALALVITMVFFQGVCSDFANRAPRPVDYDNAYKLAILSQDVPTLLNVSRNSNKYYPDLLPDLKLLNNP